MKELINQILFATDFSECSDHAFRHAMTWAQACPGQFHIAHILEIHPHMDMDAAVVQIYLEEQQKTAKIKMQALIERVELCITGVHHHEKIGNASEQINKLAFSMGTDLIVTGTHGLTGLNRVLLGSTGERVVCGAPCPVLVVRHKEPAEKTKESEQVHHGSSSGDLNSAFLPQHIVMPLDFSDCSLDAFEYGTFMAKHFGASVTLLHVIEPIVYSLDFTLTHAEEDKYNRQRVEKKVEELTSVLQSQGIKADCLIKEQPASDKILESVHEKGANLVVMGTHGRRGLSRFFMGSVASAILRQASCPVLTVKSPKFAHGHPRTVKGSCSTEQTAAS